MLEGLTFETFEGLKPRGFELVLADDDVRPLELVECVALSDRPSPHSDRIPFSLLFQGAPDLQLPQQIRRVRHATLGELDVFLVPVQPNEQGTLYEAVFN